MASLLNKKEAISTHLLLSKRNYFIYQKSKSNGKSKKRTCFCNMAG